MLKIGYPWQMVLLLLVMLPLSIVQASSPLTVQWNDADKHLTLASKQARLSQVLQSLSKLGGFKLWIASGFDPTLKDVQIQSQPLTMALKRLLSPYNHVISTRSDGSVTAVYLLPAGNASTLQLNVGDGSRQQQVLESLLASPQIPQTIKSVLLMQSMSDLTELQQTAVDSQQQAKVHAIQTLQTIGLARPETLRKLQHLVSDNHDIQHRQSP